MYVSKTVKHKKVIQKRLTNIGFGCTYLPEFAVNNVEDVESINFVNIGVEQLVRFHFSDLCIAFKFYNFDTSKHSFFERKGSLMRNCDGEITQQTFVCYWEGLK